MSIDRICASMKEVQHKACEILSDLESRTTGLRKDTPPEIGAWRIGRKKGTEIFCSNRLFSRTSAHITLARKKTESSLIDLVRPVADQLDQLGPMLQDAPFILTVPIDGSGVLYAPYWQIHNYTLRNMLDHPKADQTALARLLRDIVALPTPTGTYAIGNKTIPADSPERALSFHLRMTAPKTAPNKRKIPAYIPAIHRIWSPQEAQDMGQKAMEPWTVAGK